MQAYGVDTFPALAEKIETPENTVRNWHKRGAVPLARIRFIANQTGRPIEWFLDGGATSIFLGEKANELAKYVASDAFAGGPKYPSAPPAPDLGVLIDLLEEQQISQKRGGDAFGQVPKVTENMGHADTSPGRLVGLTATPRVVSATNAVKSEHRPPDASQVNVELLKLVLEMVEAELRTRQIKLAPERYSELVSLIYEHTSHDASTDAVGKAAQRFLRLVA
jgi:hypothetical protein